MKGPLRARWLLLAAPLLALGGCRSPSEGFAQVSMTPMKPHDTPAAMRTIGETMPTPAAMR
jgi:hypothetical protein